MKSWAQTAQPGLVEPLTAVPTMLQSYGMELTGDGAQLVYTYDAQASDTGSRRADGSDRAGIRLKDLKTTQALWRHFRRPGTRFMNLPAIMAIYCLNGAHRPHPAASIVSR